MGKGFEQLSKEVQDQILVNVGGETSNPYALDQGDPAFEYTSPETNHRDSTDEFSENYHAGLTRYILDKGYDRTYLTIANHQFHTQQSLRHAQTAEQRRAIERVSDAYLADNHEQLERTMEIRREFTQILIDRSK